jgi:crotonobetainyl-CoA:carnitine CoA-transferase CaiB-like acyl-CoA transferase
LAPDGPLGGYPGYDAIVQAMAGWFSVNGEAGGNPTRLGVAMVDMGTGLYSAVAILMALAERERSGLGQFIDMTLYDCAVSLMHPHIVNYRLSGKVPVATGNAHPNISPYDTFRTRSVDIFIGAGNDAAFAKLCELLGCSELADDPRFLKNIDRVTSPRRSESRARIQADEDRRRRAVQSAAGGWSAGGPDPRYRPGGGTSPYATSRHERAAGLVQDDRHAHQVFPHTLAACADCRRVTANIRGRFCWNTD